MLIKCHLEIIFQFCFRLGNQWTNVTAVDVDEGAIHFTGWTMGGRGQRESVSKDKIGEIVTHSGTAYDEEDLDGDWDAIRLGTAGTIISIAEKG